MSQDNVNSKRPRVFDVEQMAQEAIQIARKRFASNTTDPQIIDVEDGVDEMLDFEQGKSDTSRVSDDCDDIDVNGDESPDSTDDEGEHQGLFTTSYNMALQHCQSGQARPVTAISLDRSGERMVTGGADCSVAIWDFQCLDPNSPYRTLQPCGAHQVRQLDFGDRNDFFLVVAACAQAKILERTGKECLECVKGDQYLVDMARTKGHVSALNGGQWNPLLKQEFMTYGEDSTIRFWNVEDAKLNNSSMIKVKPLPGVAGRRHASVQACVYPRDSVFYCKTINHLDLIQDPND